MDPELLKILACPQCRCEVDYKEASQELVCRKCARRYPIRDGIPDMVIEPGP